MSITFDPNVYQPPNVYIQREDRPSIGTASNSPAIPALVGPGRSYRIRSDVVVLNGTDPVLLSQKGVDESTVVVKDAAGATVAGTEYALVAAAGADGDIGTVQDNTTTIARTGASSIPTGSAVTVTYQYADDALFSPVVLSTMDAVIDRYGFPMTSAGAVSSPLALAAQQAFLGGASEVLCVPTDEADEGDRPAGWTGIFTTAALLASAYVKIEGLANANIVVPLPVGETDYATVTAGLTTHVTTASADGNFRTAIIGQEHLVTDTPDLVAAEALSSRIISVWPHKFNYYAQNVDRAVSVGAYYTAAFLAGRLASRPAQYGLTTTRVRGLSSIPSAILSTMTESAKNSYASAGVTVIEQDISGSLSVRHGVTTDPSSILTREVSITRQEDLLISTMRSSLRNSGIIGGPIGATTLIQIRGSVFGILQNYVDQGVITGWQDLGVRQNPDDPTVVEVRFRWRPSFPLNYIVLRFSVDTTTGQAINRQAA